jgi:hypothetical protein
LNARIESGELSQFKAEREIESLRRPKAAASTRAGLASGGFIYDHVADVADGHDRLTLGDYGTVELADQVKRTVYDIGPENSQQLADEMLEEGRLSRKQPKDIPNVFNLSALGARCFEGACGPKKFYSPFLYQYTGLFPAALFCL